MDGFITPPNHFGFNAKKVTGEIKGKITGCSIAYIEPGGGGPVPSHTHAHDHLFIVIEGTTTIKINADKVCINRKEIII
jgi:mannose-6-phosphate isomerase-like protein (cupin superfamily)